MTANTHRAAGRARTPFTLRPLVTAACGAALTGAAVFASLGGAQAAPATAGAATTGAAAPSAQLSTVNTQLVSTALLKSNSVGSAVSALQSALNSNGASLKVDGIFGPRTKAAVISFQKKNGLEVDGVVGPETRGALNTQSTDTKTSSYSSSSSSSSNAIVAAARSQIGTRYSFTGNSPSEGFDCSGLVQYAYRAAGIDLPHLSSAQAAGGTRVSQSEARPGDIVYWPGHVGIYAGNGKVIDAGRSPYAVTERNIWGNPTFITYR